MSGRFRVSPRETLYQVVPRVLAAGLHIDCFWKKTVFLLIGVWSKSLVGFYPLFFDVLLAFHQKKFFKKSSFFVFLKEVFIQIFIASLWYFYSYLKYGNYFLKAHFYDQIFKRVVKPIELHWSALGIKYYPTALFQDSKILTILFFIGLVTLLFKLFFLINKKNFFFSKKFVNFLFFLFPLPLILIFSISKSKIYWYLVFITPFLTIIGCYFLFLIKNIRLRNIVVGFLFLLSAFIFIKNTYLYQYLPDINENFFLANCVKKLKSRKLAYLVDANNRQNYLFLKKNNLDTETSFIYGNSPSFVYYSDKDIDFFYDEKDFKRKYQEYPIVIIQRNDEVNLSLDFNSFIEVCQTKNPLHHERWLIYKKR